jgi:hypothetical protein
MTVQGLASSYASPIECCSKVVDETKKKKSSDAGGLNSWQSLMDPPPFDAGTTSSKYYQSDGKIKKKCKANSLCSKQMF